MKNIRSIPRLWMALSVILMIASPAMTGGLDLSWYSIDGGGGDSASGTITLTGSIGQPDAGIMTGASLELRGGFLAAASAAAIPGDCDADGDVDLLDYACIEPCITGPDGALLVGCDVFDFDSDNDVDLADFAKLNLVFAQN